MLKKKLFASALALTLGIGGLSAAAPLIVRAETAPDNACHDTSRHFSGDLGYIRATPGDGEVYLEWRSDIPQDENNWNSVDFYLCDSDTYTDENFGDESYEPENPAYIYGMNYDWEIKLPAAQGSCTISAYNAPLENDKTYYVYAYVRYTNTEQEAWTHDTCYLGVSCTPRAGLSTPADNTPVTPSAPSTETPSAPAPTSTPAPTRNAYFAYVESVNNSIKAAEAGSTIVMEKGVTAIDNLTMKALLEKGDVSLQLEFTYDGTDYVILIPAGAAQDNDIPIYGPLYLAQHYGNRAGSEAAASESYTVKSGDTLSKIARAFGMTLRDLAAKNPQITDLNKIRTGQTINLQ